MPGGGGGGGGGTWGWQTSQPMLALFRPILQAHSYTDTLIKDVVLWLMQLQAPLALTCKAGRWGASAQVQKGAWRLSRLEFDAGRLASTWLRPRKLR